MNEEWETVEIPHIFSEAFERRQQKLIEEVRQEECRRHKKRLSIAAAIALLICIPAGARAANLMRMEHMLIEQVPGDTSADTVPQKREPEAAQTEESREYYDVIAAAVPESPEWQAMRDWWEFCQKYERSYQYEAASLRADEKLKEGNRENAFSGYSEGYHILTQDMAERLEEICSTYGLQMESEDLVTGDFTYEDLKELCGVGKFVEEPFELDLQVLSACREGNWHGDYNLLDADGQYIGGGSISVTHKGIMNSCGVSTVADPGDWEQWEYVNRYGNELTLMINPVSHQHMMIYNGERDFVGVGIEPLYENGERIVFSDGRDGYVNQEGEPVEMVSMTKREIEAFADHFMFHCICGGNSL